VSYSLPGVTGSAEGGEFAAGPPAAGRGAWTEPGAFEVAPGVHRIPLPLPNDALRAVNVYAVDDGDGLVLIDSGWALAEARSQLADALTAIGAALGDVSRFLITHVHRDHYTQAVMLRHEFGSRISLGTGERPSLELYMSGRVAGMTPQVSRLRACGADRVADLVVAWTAAGPRPKTVWELPDEWITAPGAGPGLGLGAELGAGGGPTRITLPGRVLEVIPTPGHTRGHLCFRDASAGLLFAGDHVLPHITPSIGFEPALARLPLGDYLQSLRLVRERPDSVLLPAHGPVADSVHARIDELIAHHAARLDAAAAAVRSGAVTAGEAARLLTWTRHDRALDELNPFNQMMAVLETAAHLDLLVMQGRLSSTQDGDVTKYWAP
jgi:glyoxylase-like metal-dependent hydrolase (beta-lactamase superfamily II)